MKKFIAGKLACIELKQVIDEATRRTGNRHLVHVIIPPVINNDGDFLAAEIRCLEDDGVALSTPPQNGIVNVRTLGKGDAFLAEPQPANLAVKFFGVE